MAPDGNIGPELQESGRSASPEAQGNDQLWLGPDDRAQFSWRYPNHNLARAQFGQMKRYLSERLDNCAGNAPEDPQVSRGNQQQKTDRDCLPRADSEFVACPH